VVSGREQFAADGCSFSRSLNTFRTFATFGSSNGLAVGLEGLLAT